MKIVHTALLLSALLTGAVHAQSAAKPEAMAPAAAMTDGEVRKVDLDNKKITLKHGAIKNLDMPGMTMVFQVKDPAMLTQVKAGDKVRFAASNEGGKLTVTELQAAK
jgi:Cu(I)/Ag(I) efflux system protein CusF